MSSSPQWWWYQDNFSSDFTGERWLPFSWNPLVNIPPGESYHNLPIQNRPTVNERKTRVSYIQFVDSKTYIFLSGMDYLAYQNTTLAPTFHYIDNSHYTTFETDYNNSN